jgi:hypothetical protein
MKDSFNKRWVYVPSEEFVEGKGWRAAIVFEGESGHHLTGEITNMPNVPQPIYLPGESVEEAWAAASILNRERGYSQEEERRIIAESMCRTIRVYHTEDDTYRIMLCGDTLADLDLDQTRDLIRELCRAIDHSLPSELQDYYDELAEADAAMDYEDDDEDENEDQS